ncbi:MAG: YceI family protein [Pseudomonadota bacterium]
MLSRLRTIAASTALAVSLLAAPAFAADNYKFDPSHAQILFSYDHIGFSTTYGLFSGFNGTATIDQDDLSKSSVQLEMKAADMITGWEAREGHFMSADFFNAANNPLVTFTSTKVEPTGDNTAKITGNLTMAGQSKEIVLDAKLNKIGKNPINQKDWAGFNATTMLKRSDFGLGKFAPAVSDEVKIVISVELEKTS